MDEITKVLKSMWLSENEIKVYTTSLSIGQTTSSILWKKTWLTRSTARYTCQSLVSKKLMNSISKQDYYLFTAESPVKLKYILNKEISKIENKISQVNHIIPNLEKLILPHSSLPKVKYYQGVDGIIEIFEDVLQHNNITYWVLKIDDNINGDIKTYIDEQYLEKRKTLQYKSYALFNDNQLTRDYSINDSEVNRKTLLIPEKDYPFPGCCYIYGNKVAFFSFTINNLNGIIIENENITQTQLSFFKLAWDVAKKHPINQK